VLLGPGVGAGPQRNGSNSAGTSAGVIGGPVLATASVAWPSQAVVTISARPPSLLWRMAFSMRLPASRVEERHTYHGRTGWYSP
jgi:hypothetical protein